MRAPKVVLCFTCMQRTSISGAALHDNDSFFKCYCHRKCLYSGTLKETAFVPTQKWQIEVENELCTEKHKDKLIFFLSKLF